MELEICRRAHTLEHVVRNARPHKLRPVVKRAGRDDLAGIVGRHPGKRFQTTAFTSAGSCAGNTSLAKDGEEAGDCPQVQALVADKETPSADA